MYGYTRVQARPSGAPLMTMSDMVGYISGTTPDATDNSFKSQVLSYSNLALGIGVGAGAVGMVLGYMSAKKGR